MYEFQGFYIPDRMMPGITRYINDRILPGQFLQAIICNDLKAACSRADDENQRNLIAYVGYFHNEAPSQCWGSKKKMMAWVNDTPKEKQQPTVSIKESYETARLMHEGLRLTVMRGKS